jgi:hypothetical protein
MGFAGRQSDAPQHFSMAILRIQRDHDCMPT